MSAIVFASAGGRKYHFDEKCKAFHGAQDLNDWDCDEYCRHQHPIPHALKRMSSDKAAMDGKLPCLACVPQHPRTMPDAEKFGHEPIKGISLDGLSEDVCQRCTEPGVWFSYGADETRPVHIPWPCTSAIVLSAIVLGRAPRTDRDVA